MSPEIPLFVARARIWEVNPPKIEPVSFKREEPIVDVQFVSSKPKVNYFHSKAASEYKKAFSWFAKPAQPEVIVLNPPSSREKAVSNSIKRLVQKIGLDKVLAWLKKNLWPQQAYQTVLSGFYG